jgi:HPr kinase/phosphorylase
MSAPGEQSVHGVAVALAVDPDGPLAGVLILGPSGAGKSALALCLIESCPWRRTALVADDIVALAAEGGSTIARAPKRLAGKIEIRGFGPVQTRALPSVALRLCVDLGAPASRMPEPSRRKLAGDAPGLPVYPFRREGAGESAAHRLRAMTAAFLGGQS